jgi:DNA polymerase elongation subunit (family B)
MLDASILQNLDKIKKSILVFDLETSSNYPDGREVNISADFDNYVRFAKVKWFGCYSYKHDRDYYLNPRIESKKIIELLTEHNILVGFNSEEFDYPILMNNGFVGEQSQFIQVDCMSILGKNTFKNRQGYAYKNRGELMGYKFKNNSLRCIAETMNLEYKKQSIDYKIFFKDEWLPEEIEQIKIYLAADVMATKELFDKLWEYWLPFTELLEVKSIYDLSWIKSSIAAMTYKAACKVMHIDPTYTDEKEEAEEMGGNVFDPVVEEATNVWYIDFGSLYPHMFTMFNLPAEIKEEHITPSTKCWHGNNIFKVRGYYDISKWHPLSKYIYEKLKERIHLKETDPKNPMVYTLKIFLNGLYGIFRSAIFEQIHTPNCGYDCCWLGQQIQQLTKEMLEQFGFKIIYGDTDSLMFHTDNQKINTREYVTDCLNQIIDIINENAPYPVDTFKINIEKYLDYIMFPFSEQPIVGEDGKNIKEKNRLVLERKGKKKNYLMVYKENQETVVKLIGLPIIKDNATALAMKIYEECLKPAIIKTKCAKFSKEFINATLELYLKRPEIMDLLAVEYKVKSFDSYKNPNQIQAQISKKYFNGKEGIIKLIKNSKCGQVGKGELYCSIQEAVDAKLSVDEVNLEKVLNELEPFIIYERDVRNIETGIEATVTKDEFEACNEVLVPVKKKRGRPKKNLTITT